MHMPGHKRNTELLSPGLPYEIDVTEIHGFDDLYEPHGILRDAAALASELYGSKEAFLLVNGSTVGILAAIGAHAKRGDMILVAQNSHRSVCNAVSLFGLTPVFLDPGTDEFSGVSRSIDPAAVEDILERETGVKLVVITSPTYEGIVSDIVSISGITKNHGVPLLVDSAHGAHLGFSGLFPHSAVREGADIVVMSLHKTLPALTQCSLLHLCGGRADPTESARLLSTLQTSSPSYVLLASIDRCLRMLAAEKETLFQEYEKNLERFYNDVKLLKNLTVLRGGADAPSPGFFGHDPGKLVIVTKKTALNGRMLAEILRSRYKLELEMACDCYAVAMTSIADSAEGFDRLAAALIEIDCDAAITEKASSFR